MGRIIPMKSYILLTCPLCVAMLGLIFAGCVGEDDPDGIGIIDGAADTVYGEAIPTINETLEIHGGYDLLYDRTSPSPCVQRTNGEVPDVIVTSPHLELTVDTVTTRDELARSLNIDMGLKGAYGPVSGNAAFEMLDNFSQSSRSVSFLLQVKEGYIVRTRNRADMALTERAQQLLTTDLNQFVAECGTDYIEGVQLGAELFVMITFTAESDQSATEIKTSIEASSTVPTVDAGGEMSTAMTSNASHEGVSTSVVATSTGFDLIENSSGDDACAGLNDENRESLLATLASSGVTPDLFNYISCIKETMHQSVAIDRCRDSGEGQCDGAASPGFHNVGYRHSSPTGVVLGRYSAVQGASTETASFDRINSQRQSVELFVRDINRLRLQSETIYLDNLRPFLEAAPENRALFNVGNPQNVARSMRDLVDVVESYDDLFHPADDQRWGTVDRQLSALIDGCWESAALNLDHQCIANGQGVETLNDYQSALTEIERYEDSPIIRLDAIILPETVMFDDIAYIGSSAIESCAEIANGYRLPTRSEIQLLDLMVREGPVPWTPETPNEVWYGGVNDCSENMVDTSPVYQASEQGGEFLCVAMTASRAGICVPSSGPIPAM